MTGHEFDEEKVLRAAGIRPTRQRVTVLRLLRDIDGTHATADQVHALASQQRAGLPLATVYNVLNDFAKAGLVRRISFGDRTSFCTNRSAHHHFLHLATNALSDIPNPQPCVIGLPHPPDGMEIDGVDVIVRLRHRRP